jgi:hypothetical protein
MCPVDVWPMSVELSLPVAVALPVEIDALASEALEASPLFEATMVPAMISGSLLLSCPMLAVWSSMVALLI